MSRLYLRIFFAFWLVIVMTLAAVLIINSQLERDLRDEGQFSERFTRISSGLSWAAEQALERGGPEQLARWSERDPQRRGRMRQFVFDDQGRELVERDVPRRIQRQVDAWVRSGQLPDSSGPGRLTIGVSSPDHGQFLIVLARPPRPLVLRIFGPLGPAGLIGFAIVFSGLVCFWLARTISRPVQQLRLAGQALGRGELEARAPEKTCRRGDELGDLARDFNRMAVRLEALIRAQRQLLRDVSHELRSPLARLKVALVLAADSTDDSDRRKYLERIDSDIERLDQLIGEILGYARLSEGHAVKFESMELVDLLEDIAASARLEGAPGQIQVSVQAPETLTIDADTELLHRAIENVVRNALRHAPAGSTVSLSADMDNEEVIISVDDQGPGVPADRLSDIFEPFVRLSPERGETGFSGGIGLAIARAAVEHHHGRILAENRTEGGLRVRIVLPRKKVS